MATKNRNENPGVRDRARHADVPNKDINEPWISNYPPLHDWLMENNARCDWQMRYGKGNQGFMLECWRLPGSLPFVVQVFTQSMGWDVFTPSGDRKVDETLADLRARIFPQRNALTFSFQMPEGWSPERIEAFVQNVLTQARVSAGGEIVVLVKP